MDEYNLALLIIRVAVGVTMALHGIAKYRGGINGVAGWFDGMGMRPGKLHAHLAASGEILAGVFFALGLLTPFAGLGFVGLMTVAGITSHAQNGFFIIRDGWEYVFVLAIVGITVAMLGPGEWSIDHALGIIDGLDGYTGLAISAGGGLLAAGVTLGIFYRPPQPAD